MLFEPKKRIDSLKHKIVLADKFISRDIDVEFYDAQNALINILKIYDSIGQLTDVQPITTIEINVPDKR